MVTLPLVLCHGIARFDVVSSRLGANLYFKGISAHLTAHGFDVYEPTVPFAASVEERAHELKHEVVRIIERTGAGRVHLIAHSMGGLDARHMIVDEGMASRVATLTTIGTPHRGSPFADRVLEQAPQLVNVPARLGLDLAGTESLTTAACATFNARAEPLEATNSVVYTVITSHQRRPRIFAPLQRCWDVISEAEGANDGLVSLVSQRWTSELRSPRGTKKVFERPFPFEADHLNELGWWDVHELAGTRWWQVWKIPIRARARWYEARVRRVYLDAAHAAAEA